MLNQSNIWIEELSMVFLVFLSQVEIRIYMSVTYFVFTQFKNREGLRSRDNHPPATVHIGILLSEHILAPLWYV